MIDDAQQKIARPRQIYVGAGTRDYVPIEQRTTGTHELAGVI